MTLPSFPSFLLFHLVLGGWKGKKRVGKGGRKKIPQSSKRPATGMLGPLPGLLAYGRNTDYKDLDPHWLLLPGQDIT